MRPIDISRAALAAALVGDRRLVAEAGDAMSAVLAAPWSRADGLSGRVSMDCAFNLALAG